MPPPVARDSVASAVSTSMFRYVIHGVVTDTGSLSLNCVVSQSHASAARCDASCVSDPLSAKCRSLTTPSSVSLRACMIEWSVTLAPSSNGMRVFRNSSR